MKPQIKPWSFRNLKSFSGVTNAALEPRIQPLSLRSSPEASGPAAELEILVWKLECKPGSSDPLRESHYTRNGGFAKWMISENTHCPNIEMWFWRWQAWEWKVREEIPHERNHFQAAGQILGIWLSRRQAWNWKWRVYKQFIHESHHFQMASQSFEIWLGVVSDPANMKRKTGTKLQLHNTAPTRRVI